MIYITCGTCGTSKGYKTAADGAISLPAPEEARLVRRGVASYATKPIIDPDNGVATPGEGGDSGSLGDTPPERDPASTGQETGDGEDDGEDEDTAELQEGEVETDDVLDIVDGHFTVESLMKLSRPALNELGDKLGVDVRKCKNKGEASAMLATVEVQADDDEDTPPDLGAEAPVV